MIRLNQDQKEELEVILKRAQEFHGHLGPFLALGVRMGIIGLRELREKGNDEGLRVTVMVRDSPPFSCVIDGIQVATKCTIGNKKLTLINCWGVAAKFELQHGEEVDVEVDSVAFDRLKHKLLSENVNDEELRKLAYLVASMPEEELFIIRKK